MADAFANSIMVDALNRSRAGIVVPGTNTYYASSQNGTALDDEDDLERWEPWVRAYTELGELLQGVVFDMDNPNKNVTVSFAADTGGAWQTHKIASINRPKHAVFVAQLDLVSNWAVLREERATEVMAQIDPTYAFWSSVVYLHPSRTRWTMELINVMLQFCVYVEMRFKHALACWRPVEYSPTIQPMITTPGHGSFPSGHATQAHAVAQLLDRLHNLKSTTVAGLPMVRDQLPRRSARIPPTGVVAGVHFPVDSMAGRMLGVALADFLVARCTDGQYHERSFDSAFLNTATNRSLEFNPFDPVKQDLDSTTSGDLYNKGTQHTLSASSAPAGRSQLLKKMWKMAEHEWVGRFGL